MSFPRIKRILLVDGTGACWQEDIGAIRGKYVPASDRWVTPASNPGMKFIRQPSHVMQTGLQLESGETAWGDCVSVSFAGKSGRDGSLEANSTRELLELPRLYETLRGCADWDLAATEATLAREFPRWTSAIRFGISQALVNAISIATRKMPCEILREALALPVTRGIVPIPAFQGSCGSDWHGAAERMIVAGVEYLPQGQFEDINDELGSDGRKLFQYVDWLKARIGVLSRGTRPRAITIDFHGAAGQLFSGEMHRVAQFIGELSERCRPFDLHVESPVVEATFDGQMSKLGELSAALRARGITARVIADEWANSLDQIQALANSKVISGIHIKMPDTGSLLDSGRAVAACKSNGIFVILGGSCTETATSSRLAAHLAMATGPDAILVKPGISFDEGFSLVRNELLMIQSLLAVTGDMPEIQESTSGKVSVTANLPATMSVWP